MLFGQDLQAIREEIEEIDRDLMKLLKRRMDVVESVARAKLKSAFPYRDHQREERVLQRVRRAAVQLGLDARAVERLYRLIMEMSISHQQAFVQSLETVPLRVAYQGAEGSYSHLTAQRRYAGRTGGVLLTGYETLREAVGSLRSGMADAALLPIENSTAGSINETYDLLAEGGLTINAEAVSQVEHCLITLPGIELEHLRRVMSHPQALAQCEIYLRSVPWIRTEAVFDTAGAARKIKEENLRDTAAIASESAANLYGLEILRRGIQTQTSNSTRFVEIGIESSPCPADVPCKTSLLITLDQNAVTLGEVLIQFGRRNIPLSKLESRPIQSTVWRYRFYLDVEAHAASVEMEEALVAVEEIASEMRILGTYPRAS